MVRAFAFVVLAVWRLGCVVHTNSCIMVAVLVLLCARAQNQRTLAYILFIHTTLTLHSLKSNGKNNVILHGPRVECESEGEGKGGGQGGFGLEPGSGLGLGSGFGLGLPQGQG